MTSESSGLDRRRGELAPDWSIHPGAYLASVLAEQGLRQSELAERTGLSPKHVNQMVGRSIGITGDVALLLERALGVEAEMWMAVQSDWELAQSRSKAEVDLLSFRDWAARFDRSTLVREGVVAKTDDPLTRVGKLLRFFGVSSPEAFEETWMRPRVSFRRAQNFSVVEANTALWLRLVDRAASGTHVTDFRPAGLRKIAGSIPALSAYSVPDGFLAARELLRRVGVSLVFVNEVPKTGISGATWWLDARSPVIGVTARQKRPDIFWFTLMHEIGHLSLHPKRSTFLDLKQDLEHADGEEGEANRFAHNLLLDGVDIEVERLESRADFILLAREYGVGVSMIAGQYARLTGEWAMVSSLRGSISDEDIAALVSITASDALDPVASDPADKE